MRFELDVFGDVQVSREILRFGARGSDMRPAFRSIVDFIMGEERHQFASEGRYASGGWKRLKDATIAAKRREHLDLRILHATHALRDSLTRRGARYQILEVSRGELRFGTSRPGAAAHQRPKDTNPLPQRRPLELREFARREILKKLQRYVLTGQAA